MKRMIQMGLAATVAFACLATTAWAQTGVDSKATAKKPVSKSSASKPVVDTVFPYPAATGVMPCEDGVTVTIAKDSKRADGFDVMLGKTRYPTTRVATDSGAIRLENKGSGIVWLQMANKSMLFNEKAGKRLANNCHNAAQAAADKALSNSTVPNMLETPEAKKP
jgi:hypothetical protein